MRNFLDSIKCFRGLGFIKFFIIASVTAAGLFNEYLSCAAGAVLCIYLFWLFCKNKYFKIYVNLAGISILAIVLFYGLSVFWAVDKGAAFLGFIKFLPLLLFLAALMQQDINAEAYLPIVPHFAVVITVVSTVLAQFSYFKSWFTVSGRISGFFQYPNTYALFMLSALIITVLKEKHRILDYIEILVLLFGIIYSGSRTVFVLLIISVAAMLFWGKNKKLMLAAAGITLAVVLAAVIFAAATGNTESIGRFLTISFKESTFAGRLLYAYDAAPVILRHPFGLGYMGYYYLQPSFQTGVYSVRYIHNDFLQLMLDVGWVPALLFVGAIAKAFFKKGASLKKRLIIFVISAHAFFDFDLQFIAVFMFFLLFLDYKEGKEVTVRPPKAAGLAAASLIAVLFIYMGTALSLFYFGKYEISSKIYPPNTQNDINLLVSADGADEMDDIADRIIKRNKYVSLAYDAKARAAYSRGDFASLIDYKKKSLKNAPFNYDSYEEYCYMLMNGIYLYGNSGDYYSADYCKKELLAAVENLESNSEKLSSLGKMINDQPKTDLPEDIREYVEAVK